MAVLNQENTTMNSHNLLSIPTEASAAERTIAYGLATHRNGDGEHSNNPTSTAPSSTEPDEYEDFHPYNTASIEEYNAYLRTIPPATEVSLDDPDCPRWMAWPNDSLDSNLGDANLPNTCSWDSTGVRHGPTPPPYRTTCRLYGSDSDEQTTDEDSDQEENEHRSEKEYLLYSENMNPSLTMSQKAKEACGWQPAYKLLSRKPSYPGKVYRRQPVCGPRPCGRTFWQMKQRQREKAIQEMQLRPIQGKISHFTGSRSLELPANHPASPSISLLSEQPIHRALRRSEGTEGVSGNDDILNRAAAYMKAQLYPSNDGSENGLSTSNDGHDDTELYAEHDAGIEYDRHTGVDCDCRGTRSFKCKSKKAIAAVKQVALESKAKIGGLFKN